MNALTRGAIIPQRQSKIFSTLFLFFFVFVFIRRRPPWLCCPFRPPLALCVCCPPIAGRGRTRCSHGKEMDRPNHRPSDRTVSSGSAAFFLSSFCFCMDKRFLIHRLVCCRGSQSTHHHGPVLMCVLSRPGIKQIEKIETKKKGGRNRTIPSSR